MCQNPGPDLPGRGRRHGRHDVDIREVAAALAFLAQDRPYGCRTGRPDIASWLPGRDGPPLPATPTSLVKTTWRDPSNCCPRLRRGRLARYRIGVGRRHMASRRDIVGAIANRSHRG